MQQLFKVCRCQTTELSLFNWYVIILGYFRLGLPSACLTLCASSHQPFCGCMCTRSLHAKLRVAQQQSTSVYLRMYNSLGNCTAAVSISSSTVQGKLEKGRILCLTVHLQALSILR